jgi:PHD/YefM family antitoxin component YafN of YafNO toxin-antitoxin module
MLCHFTLVGLNASIIRLIEAVVVVNRCGVRCSIDLKEVFISLLMRDLLLNKHYILNVQLLCMNVISTTILRNNLADALKEITNKKDYLLVAKKGKITSALVNIELFEDLLALVNKKYVTSIKKARKEYKKGDFFTHEEVFGAI